MGLINYGMFLIYYGMVLIYYEMGLIYYGMFFIYYGLVLIYYGMGFILWDMLEKNSNETQGPHIFFFTLLGNYEPTLFEAGELIKIRYNFHNALWEFWVEAIYS